MTENGHRRHDAGPSSGRLTDSLGLRAEVVRKIIHLATVAVPVAVWFLPRTSAIALLGTGVLLALLVEVARSRVRIARYHFLTRTRGLLRRGERKGFAGATYMAIAYFLAVLVFPRPVAVVAMLYDGIGDAVAALVGKRWGRNRMGWGKSIEGAVAGGVANLGIGLAVPGISAVAALLGAVVASLLEFLPLPLDDNLRVTLGGGLALWLATTWIA